MFKTLWKPPVWILLLAAFVLFSGFHPGSGEGAGGISSIQLKYSQVKQTIPGIGNPVTAEIPAVNGGAYQDYSGGYTIAWHPTTGAHLIYGLIREKWRKMGAQEGPSGYPTTDERDTANKKGRYNNFQQGTIIFKFGAREAFSVYGKIYSKWGSAGFDSGFLGYPLMDEAVMSGNTGIFLDFDNGAIYYSHATKQTYIVRSPVLEAWASRGRELGPSGFPVQDTVLTGKIYTQAFQHRKFECEIKHSQSIYSDKIITRISPVFRFAVFENTQDKLNPEFKLTFLNEHLRLKTCVVVFSGSYTRQFTWTENNAIFSQYQKFADTLDAFTSGLCRVDKKEFRINYTIPKSEFFDYIPGDGIFQAEFNSYDRVADILNYHGYSPADFDVISIVLPWQDTANDVRSGWAWYNPEHKMKFNDSTWSTVHNVVNLPTEEDMYWAFFLHEHSHIVNYILGKHGYNFDELGPDHLYWGQSYPDLTQTNIYKRFVPQPVNHMPERGPGFLLYPITMRWKSLLAHVPVPVINTNTGTQVKWGSWVKETAITGYGRATLLMYSSPQTDLLVEHCVRVKETEI
jgi:hypothetical protein